MKILVVGAGPAGLYFARLRKRHYPGDEILVLEQNAAGRTYGFGVSIAERATDRYLQVDEALARRIQAASLPMPQQRFTLGDQSYLVTSTQYGAAIERRRLLDIMAASCDEVGVPVHYEVRLEDVAAAAVAHDLVVGADGANSVVLAQDEPGFAPRWGELGNRFAWYGVARSLPEAGLSFRRHRGWCLVGHYYPYTEHLSTFVAECDGPSWDAGFGALSDAERKAVFEQVFATELQGQPLVENRSIWRRFRHVDNARWHAGNRVLLGDALAVAHYSIGSGTRLAMDDALALFDAMPAHACVADALAAFEQVRRPVRAKLMGAARASWDWYEDIARHVELPLMDFVHAFMTRTGRMDERRLAEAVPQFAADHAAWLRTRAGHPA